DEWESYSATIFTYAAETILLEPNTCLQARSPLGALPPGTYRIGISHSAGRAYSEPVAVP
ncbi:MAG: hypothetical protein PVF27_09170, partial [Gemmatimonadales bacterium]